MGRLEEIVGTMRMDLEDNATSQAVTNLSKVKVAMQAVEAGSEAWNTAFKNVQGSMKNMGIGMTQQKRGMEGFQKDMGNLGIGINENSEFFRLGTSNVLRYGEVSKKVAQYGVRPFRGEMLSLMFVVQSAQRFFGGMVKTVLEAMGMFDLWRGVLISILAPVLAPLIEKWLPKLMEWLGNEENAKFAGKIILWGLAIAFVIGWIAKLNLLFMKWDGTIGAVTAAFKYLSSIFGVKSFFGVLTIIGSIIALLVGMWNIWKGITGPMNEAWRIIKGILYVLIGIVAIIAIILHAPALIVAGIAAALLAIVHFLSEVEAVKDVFQAIGEFIRKIVDWIVDINVKAFKWLAGIVGLQEGGIVTRPTLTRLGERGPEAVIPLTGPHAGGAVSINYAPTISVSSTGGGINVDAIASAINERLFEDLRRIGIR